MYAAVGRFSIPPERLLKAWVLIDLSPNPPKDTDGRRVGKRKGGEGATGEIAWVPFGVGRSADGLHRRTGAPMAVCGSCDARDGERIRSRELSRTGLARVCGDLRLSGGWVGGDRSKPGRVPPLGLPQREPDHPAERRRVRTYWVLLLWDCFAATKPLSQIQRSTLWPLQDANQTPSLGGFGVKLSQLVRRRLAGLGFVLEPRLDRLKVHAEVCQDPSANAPGLAEEGEEDVLRLYFIVPEPSRL